MDELQSQDITLGSSREASPEKGAANQNRADVKNISSNRLAVTRRAKTNNGLDFMQGRVIEPDTNIVYRAYSYDTSLVDGMTFREDDSHSWDIISQDFVLGVGNQRIREFLRIVHGAKIETERKMRFQLDLKILNAKNDRLSHLLGKDFI